MNHPVGGSHLRMRAKLGAVHMIELALFKIDLWTYLEDHYYDCNQSNEEMLRVLDQEY
jgi:hypothetical protein